MGSAAANRQALWDREKADRASRPAPPPTGYEPPKRRVYNLRSAASWAVCKVFDDPRKLPIAVKMRLLVEEAEVSAGRMRDGMTDEEVGRAVDEGWTYKPMRLAGMNKTRVANPDDGEAR